MDFVWLYENLADYKSKYILYAILNNYYNFDFISLGKVTNDIYKHYFDLDILKLQQDEVFVDMGAYIGDTTLDFINSYGTDSYKIIYCYEMTKKSLESAKKNLNTYDNIIFKNFAVSDKNGKLYMCENGYSSSANQISTNGEIEVDCVSLDNDISEKITTIKMDIESGEKKALKEEKKIYFYETLK